MKECLLHESQAIRKAAENLNKEVCDQALIALNKTFEKHGKLLLSGVGKSGIVARKIASTFTSLGFPALFLNPTDALHGDLGIAMRNDTAIFLSNSGETAEILELLPHINKKVRQIISITGESNSTLSKISNIHLNCYVDRESCPLDLAPTTSTTLSLAIGDALAAQWSISRGINDKVFALNHPAGSIGKRLTLTVDDIMFNLSDLPCVSYNSNIKSIIITITSSLVNKENVGFAWVKNDIKRVVGLITDGDLRRALSIYPSSEWDKIVAKDIYTKNPKIIDKGTLAIDALDKMERNLPKAINNLGVTNNGEIIGFVTMHSILKRGLKII